MILHTNKSSHNNHEFLRMTRHARKKCIVLHLFQFRSTPPTERLLLHDGLFTQSPFFLLIYAYIHCLLIIPSSLPLLPSTQRVARSLDTPIQPSVVTTKGTGQSKPTPVSACLQVFLYLFTLAAPPLRESLQWMLSFDREFAFLSYKGMRI